MAAGGNVRHFLMHAIWQRALCKCMESSRCLTILTTNAELFFTFVAEGVSIIPGHIPGGAAFCCATYLHFVLMQVASSLLQCPFLSCLTARATLSGQWLYSQEPLPTPVTSITTLPIASWSGIGGGSRLCGSTISAISPLLFLAWFLLCKNSVPNYKSCWAWRFGLFV